MDFCHINIKILKRSAGRSAVAASAYISGTAQHSEWSGKEFDYTHKGGVVCSEILLPKNAPKEFMHRDILWNSAEKAETYQAAQLAREVEVALPSELTHDEQWELVKRFVHKNFVDGGMCADISLHDKKDGNPHAHILLTMRPLNDDGTWGEKSHFVYAEDENGNHIPNGKGGWLGKKVDTTNWNQRSNMEKWRAAWAEEVNAAYRAKGINITIDHRSYKRQGINQEPTIHMGVSAKAMERRGVQSDRGNINRNIIMDNKELQSVAARLGRLNAWVKGEAEQQTKNTGLQLAVWQAMRRKSTALSRKGKVNALSSEMKMYNFLQYYGIDSMKQLSDKVHSMYQEFYGVKGAIAANRKKIAQLKQRISTEGDTEGNNSTTITDEEKEKIKAEIAELESANAKHEDTAKTIRNELMMCERIRSLLKDRNTQK